MDSSKLSLQTLQMFRATIGLRMKPSTIEFIYFHIVWLFNCLNFLFFIYLFFWGGGGLFDVNSYP